MWIPPPPTPLTAAELPFLFEIFAQTGPLGGPNNFWTLTTANQLARSGLAAERFAGADGRAWGEWRGMSGAWVVGAHAGSVAARRLHER